MAGLFFGLAGLAHPQGVGYVVILLLIGAGKILLAPSKRQRYGQIRQAALLALVYGSTIAAFYIPAFVVTGQTPLSSKTGINLIIGDDMDEFDLARTAQSMYSLDDEGNRSRVGAESQNISLFSYILQQPTEMAARIYRNLGNLDRQILPEATRPSQFSGAQSLFAILVVLGILGQPWSKVGSGSHLYLGAFLAYAIMSNSLFFFHQRLVLPIIPLLLIWAANGLVFSGKWLDVTMKNMGIAQFQNLGYVQKKYLAWGLAIGLLVILGVNNYRTESYYFSPTGLYQIEMGEWMKDRVPQDIRLMTDNPFVPYYFFDVQQDYIILPHETCDRIINYAHQRGVDYIAVTEWRITGWQYPCTDFFSDSVTTDGLYLIHEWEFDSDRRARLFRLTAE